MGGECQLQCWPARAALHGYCHEIYHKTPPTPIKLISKSYDAGHKVPLFMDRGDRLSKLLTVFQTNSSHFFVTVCLTPILFHRYRWVLSARSAGDFTFCVAEAFVRLSPFPRIVGLNQPYQKKHINTRIWRTLGWAFTWAKQIDFQLAHLSVDILPRWTTC